MTPKEKATDLFEKFCYTRLYDEQAKECAIITVDEITYHYPEFPLRLYALKISNNIVVLFNGGIKDGPTNQTSSLFVQWRAACEFAKKIEQALRNGTISIDEKTRKLKNYDGSNEIIL